MSDQIDIHEEATEWAGSCSACLKGRKLTAKGKVECTYPKVNVLRFGAKTTRIQVRLCDPCLRVLRDACARALMGRG